MQGNYGNYTHTCARKEEYPQEGERIMFEGEEGYVIRVTPLLVIKTKKRVVCGALHKYLNTQIDSFAM